MGEEVTRLMMFTTWGSYLKKDYMETGLDVTEVLMKHWGIARLLEGVSFSYDEGIEDIDSISTIKEEILNNRKRYNLYDVTFFTPLLQKKSM